MFNWQYKLIQFQISKNKLEHYKLKFKIWNKEMNNYNNWKYKLQNLD